MKIEELLKKEMEKFYEWFEKLMKHGNMSK